MDKPTISQLLWETANCRLAWDDNSHKIQGRSIFCCIAIRWALAPYNMPYSEAVALIEAAKQFLYDMGMPSFQAFSDYCNFEEAQQVRYAWLMLASQVAKEEGI